MQSCWKSAPALPHKSKSPRQQMRSATCYLLIGTLFAIVIVLVQSLVSTKFDYTTFANTAECLYAHRR